MDKEKFETVLNYFKEVNIELPPDVHNAIEDVFLENDEIESVECYHLEDYATFQKDLRMVNTLKTYEDGNSEGEIHSCWTYFGDLTISYTESINLYDEDDNIIVDISNIENEADTIINDPSAFNVILVETASWNSKKKEKLKKVLTLYIYCPYPGNDEEVDKYEKAYNSLFEGGLEDDR